jgi:hypothetical protein
MGQNLDLMNEQDINDMQNIIKIKKKFISFFKKEIIVDKIKSYIKNSMVLDFINERVEKNINTKKPIFMLLINKNKAEEKYTDFEDRIQWLTSIAYQEVINPFSTFLTQSINNEEFKNYVLEDLKDVSNKEELLEIGLMVMTSIFALKIDKERNIVHLEYMI